MYASIQGVVRKTARKASQNSARRALTARRNLSPELMEMLITAGPRGRPRRRRHKMDWFGMTLAEIPASYKGG